MPFHGSVPCHGIPGNASTKGRLQWERLLHYMGTHVVGKTLSLEECLLDVQPIAGLGSGPGGLVLATGMQVKSGTA